MNKSKKLFFTVIFFCLVLCSYTATANNAAILAQVGSDRDVEKTIAHKPAGFTFKVDDVTIAKSSLIETNAKNLIQYEIGKEALFIPNSHQSTQLVSGPHNALIATLQECYSFHRPLVLSPDAIWLAICQGVAIHINQKIDSLESVIFLGERPKELQIRNDSLKYDVKHWQSLIQSLSAETQKYAKKDFYSFFVSEFSTTTDVEQTAYQVSLLSSYKKLFTYVGESGCGIPYITLSGTKDDWQLIYNKLDKLDEFGLGFWGETLKPVIQEFVNVFEDKTNTVFWQSIYKDASEYNAFYVSGWFIKFFPYIICSDPDVVISYDDYDEENGGVKVPLIYTLNPYLQNDDYLLSTLSTKDFPSGISEIEIVWNNHFDDATKIMNVYSGFFAIRQYHDKSLEPFISWAICDKDARPYNIEVQDDENLELPPAPREYWSPNIAKKPDQPAIYKISVFDNHAESVNFVITEIEKSIIKEKRFDKNKLQNIGVDFIILSNGKIAKIEIKGCSNSGLKSFIENQLLNLPDSWQPAMDHPASVMMIMNFSPYTETEEYDNLKVRLNSKVSLVLFNQ